MNDNTFQHAITRPEGPKKRASLPRMNDPHNWETMGNKKDNSQNTSNSSTQSTPLDSTLEIRRRSPRYPNLNEIRKSILDDSIRSTGTSVNQSLSDTSNSSASEESSDNQNSFNIPFTSENKQPLTNQKPKYQCLNNSCGQSQQSSKPGCLQMSDGILVICMLVIITVFVITIFTYNSQSKNEEQRGFEKLLIRKIADLRSRFPSQDENIWGYFGSGIAGVQSKDHRPAIFLLIAAHDETTNCLAKKVAELARSIFSGTGDVVLTPDKLENNISKVLDLIENRINRSKAMVVLDLLKVQPEALKAFHDICDPYYPLVAEAVYVFTMSPAVREESGTWEKYAEKQLRNRFSDTIIEDTLKALIVRITGGAVLTIKEEKNIPCSD